MAHECSICSRQLRTTNPRTFYCSKCYKQWKDEILNKSKWVRFLGSNESARRRWNTYREKGKVKHVELVWGLGTDIDIQNGKVIYLKEKGEE